MQTINDKITTLIEPILEEFSAELVLLRLLGTQELTVQIMLEHKDGSSITIEEFSKISRQVSTLLDVEDIFTHAYMLEVSSPGIDRPLTRLKDFENHVGYLARFELSAPLPDTTQKKYKGIITKVLNAQIFIDTDTGPIVLPFEKVKDSKLVLTDELIKKGQETRQQKMMQTNSSERNS